MEEILKDRSKRANRRRELAKKKKLSEKVYGTPIFADHMKPCSCDLCCNPRHSDFNKSDHKSLQEKRFDIECKKDYDECL